VALDQYGGYLSLPAPGGATGHFRTHKFAGPAGGRWLLVTPDGNGFFMRGVYHVAGSTQTTEQSTTYDTVFLAKYGTVATGWNQANLRLKARGFNAHGPYTYTQALATGAYGGTTKLPFTYNGPNPGITGYNVGAGSFKILYRGLDTAVSAVFAGSAGGFYPDAYDPVFTTNAVALFAADSNLATFKTSSWFIGMFSDDTDFLSGMGPGVDFATDPPVKYHWHLGFLALVTAPTQTTNVHAAGTPAYTDSEVYTKTALQAWLTGKYGTVGALNTAWGSTYTTLGSDGGWPTGAGLMDENGRSTHSAWLGTSYNDPWNLPSMSATVKADLDLFLYEMALTLFTIERDAFKAIAPDKLFMGPTNLGGAGWRSPTRGPILKAAGEILDVVNTGADMSQEQTDFIALWAGDVPISTWHGIVANPDSGRFRNVTMEAATWVLNTQSERASYYQADMANLLTKRAASTGTIPWVGNLWWEWRDNMSELVNWGLVSMRDNAYDGAEARVAAGTDPWGYATGGEEDDYGDFLGPVTAAHAGIEATLLSQITRRGGIAGRIHA